MKRRVDPAYVEPDTDEDRAEPPVSGYDGDKPPKDDHRQTNPQLILPSSGVSFIECAGKAFPRLAKKKRYFVQGKDIVEIGLDKKGHSILLPLRPSAFRSRLEEHFKLKAWRVHKEDLILLPARCPKETAEAILDSTPARECLPGIQLLANSPIICEQGGKLQILDRGYHQFNGGVYVLRKVEVPSVNPEEAKEALVGLLKDFDFVTRSDLSRAVANLISPALRFGRLLDCDFPLDVSEADKSQSGKTYRQKSVCALYGEYPYIITRRENGVGSVDESISSGLASGRAFLCFDNIRGPLDSQILESTLRGHGSVNVRVPYRGEILLSVDHVCWQLSSNKASATRDLANRSIITRIRCHQKDYQYTFYPEGDLLDHIRQNQGYYLGCVFANIRAWFEAGKPGTSDCRHDFREWCQSLDWIVRNLFGLPPLLDGHQEEQERISNPHLNWLRDVAIALEHLDKIDEGLRVAELVDLCASCGLELPGHRHVEENQQPLIAGRILNKLFRDTERLLVGEYQVRRDQREEYNPNQRRKMRVNYFWFERPNL